MISKFKILGLCIRGCLLCEILLDMLVSKYLSIPRLTKARLKISWKEISVMIFLLSLFFRFLFKDFDTGSHAAIFKLDGMS